MGVTYWDWTLTPVLDDNKNVDVLVFSLNDVTQQVQVEQKLRDREEYLRKLTDAIGIAIFSVSFPGRTISFVNHGAEECFGYSAVDMIGRTTRMLYPDDSQYEEYGRKVQSALEGGREDVHAELRLVRKNGELFWADVRTTFLSAGDGHQHLISVVQDISVRKKMNGELHRSREQLRLLYANLQRRREEERARIAREIHDSIGQALTVLKMDVALLADDLHDAKDDRQFGFLMKRIESINEVLDSASKVVREISSELRPVILDSLGLSAAIEWQLSEFGTKFGIPYDFGQPQHPIRLDRDRSTALFRILQECLVNVARHARANRVLVRLGLEGEHVVLDVFDDGIGVRESDPLTNRSLGILGMKERAAAFGGVVEIQRGQDKGTHVRAMIPFGELKPISVESQEP
ncbi:MAG: hypothetical protein HBSIN02_06510 [Bacteroidia bacterium]|nr:MAG: hypothetical protein HBSIN02_06510 [Bacteroidia bacterium]